jgi:hypothetical protein
MEPSSPVGVIPVLKGLTGVPPGTFQASSFGLRGLFRPPEGVSLRSVKHWLVATRRRLSRATEALAGRPETTIMPGHSINE